MIGLSKEETEDLFRLQLEYNIRKSNEIFKENHDMCHECNWPLEKTREEKLEIARKAYQEIIYVINKWENESGLDIGCHWDECISVDDELFHGHELRKE